MKLRRKFQPAVSGQQLESRTVLSQAGSVAAALTSHVAHLAPAEKAEAAAVHPGAHVQAERNTKAPATSSVAYLEGRNQLVQRQLMSAGNAILTASTASPKSAAARQVLSNPFWARVNRLDQLQTSLATAIHATNPSQVIEDPIVSVPAFHNALQTLLANNSAWFAGHPGSQQTALDLKYEGDYAGTYTGTWTDSSSSDSGTVTLQITSFRPSAADPSAGDLEGTISISGVASQLPVRGQMTSSGFTLSYSPSDLVGIIPTPFINSVSISGGSQQSINGSFHFSDIILISTAPTGGTGTLQKVG